MPLSRRFVLGAPAAFASLQALVPRKGWAAQALRIGIIGAGSQGGTVGRLWVQAGHEVLFSSRHPDELVVMTRPLGPRASAGTPRQAAEFGPVVLIAVPYDALPQLGRDLQDVLPGKIVLDATNPGPGSDNALTREAMANGVGQTSTKYLPATRLVRAFSAVDAWAVAASGGRQSGKLGVPIAGDDAQAVEVAAQLVRDAGCEPVVVDNLVAARSFQRGGPGFRANTIVIHRARRQTVYTPGWQDWLWYTILPGSLYAILALAALLLRRTTQLALFGISGAALGLLLLGIHNAWDTVTYIVVGGPRGTNTE